MNTFIVVPEFCEGYRAVETVNKILKLSKQNVIVIDDGSTDNSWEILKSSFASHKRVVLLRHVINLGKGAAMKTGAIKAFKMGADSVIFIDADGQHNPKHLKDFESALENFDLAFGYRELNGEMPFVRKWGNIIAKRIVRNLFNVKRKEFLCGFLGFRKAVYSKVKWSSSRYGVETEIATRVGRNNLTFKEIKIDTIYIDKYKGVNIFDAFKVLFQIPYWYFTK